MILFATIRISYIKQAIAIFMIHLHMHRQTWESTVFNQCSPSFHFLVLMHCDSPNKLQRKSHAAQCLALYSRWQTQQMHVYFQLGLSAVQTSESMSKTQGNTLLVLLLYKVLYCVSYCDNYIRIRIVSWKNVSLQAYIYLWLTTVYLNSDGG